MLYLIVRTGRAPLEGRQIGYYNDRIASKFDRHLGGIATEVPVKF